MTVLVTGASGFLGRRLAEMLIERGERVRLLARPASRLDDLAGRVDGIDRCSFDDAAGLRRALGGIDIVYHCAGHAADWGSWDTFHQANVEAPRALLEAALAVGSVKRFVHVSTTDVYGYPVIAGDETMPPTDIGLPYNRSKLRGDRLALDFGAREGLPVTVVRPATIFGPRSKDWVVELCRLLRQRVVVTLDGGHTGAGLVYVDDVAEAMMRLAALPTAIGRAVNIVDPTRMTWRAYFDAMADGIGAPRPRINLNSRLALALAAVSEGVYRAFRLRYRPLFTRHVVLTLCRDQNYRVDALTALIGEFPIIGLREGLSRTIVWAKDLT
ncbi:MAG TPA: NAD-dependent epimerase/dehydratase family protein [Stellaceae bacterium]|nr:NAD-dependent epimerase/dehydratase family protein [Stellaceae bacterium]